MSCMENYDEMNNGEGRCSRFFPDTIKDLLKSLACEWVVITLKNGCKERVKIECVTCDVLVVRDQNAFRFINIDCICSVCVNSETILSSLINPHCN